MPNSTLFYDDEICVSSFLEAHFSKNLTNRPSRSKSVGTRTLRKSQITLCYQHLSKSAQNHLRFSFSSCGPSRGAKNRRDEKTRQKVYKSPVGNKLTGLRLFRKENQGVGSQVFLLARLFGLSVFKVRICLWPLPPHFLSKQPFSD